MQKTEIIEFFKDQSKEFLRDYKTQYQDENGLFKYKGQHFNVGGIVKQFGIDEGQEFKLMRAQHYIAQMAGFKKWDEMIHKSEAMLELGKLLLENRDDISVHEWLEYIKGRETVNPFHIEWTDELKLNEFKTRFLPKNSPYRKSHQLKYQGGLESDLMEHLSKRDERQEAQRQEKKRANNGWVIAEVEPFGRRRHSTDFEVQRNNRTAHRRSARTHAELIKAIEDQILKHGTIKGGDGCVYEITCSENNEVQAKANYIFDLYFKKQITGWYVLVKDSPHQTMTPNERKLVNQYIKDNRIKISVKELNDHLDMMIKSGKSKF